MYDIIKESYEITSTEVDSLSFVRLSIFSTMSWSTMWEVQIQNNLWHSSCKSVNSIQAIRLTFLQYTLTNLLKIAAVHICKPTESLHHCMVFGDCHLFAVGDCIHYTKRFVYMFSGETVTLHTITLTALIEIVTSFT